MNMTDLQLPMENKIQLKCIETDFASKSFQNILIFSSTYFYSKFFEVRTRENIGSVGFANGRESPDTCPV